MATQATETDAHRSGTLPAATENRLPIAVEAGEQIRYGRRG
ncbi:hypothetical protein [Nocardia sp. NPDC050718]